MNFPAFKIRRQIGCAIHYAITLVRPRNRQSNSLNLRPFQFVLPEKFRDGIHPAADDGVAAILGIRWALEQFGGDGLAVFPDGGDLGGGGAAVGSDEYFLAHDMKLMRVKLGIMAAKARIISVSLFNSFNLIARESARNILEPAPRPGAGALARADAGRDDA